MDASQLIPALIGAGAAIVTAALACLMIVWQIGKQRRYSLEQNRHIETLKLKHSVYLEIQSLCKAAAETAVEVSTFVRSYIGNIQNHHRALSYSVAYVPPARAGAFIDAHYACIEAALGMMRATERWQIIDNRIEIFRTGFNVALSDIAAAHKVYLPLAIATMPIDPAPAANSATPTWAPPDAATMEALVKATHELGEAYSDLMAYTYDFQVEMQNLLLGELFENRVGPRVPEDKTMIVITLDQFKDIDKTFRTKTRWGLEQAAAVVRAKQA